MGLTHCLIPSYSSHRESPIPPAQEDIQERVTEATTREYDGEECRSRLDFVDGYVDKVVLRDVECLENRGVLDKIVTSDKSHIYGNQDRIEAVLGVRVLYIKDEFANHSLPTEAEST